MLFSWFTCHQQILETSLPSRSSADTLSTAPRVLLPKDIFVDETCRLALETLRQHYEFYLSKNELKRVLNTQLHCDQSVDNYDVETPAPTSVQDDTDSSSCSSDTDHSPDEAKLTQIIEETIPLNNKLATPFVEGRQATDKISCQVEWALQTLKLSGDENRLCLTCKGFKGGEMSRQVNQDQALVVFPLCPLKPSLLIGVLDGHGQLGHLVANFCRQELEKDITEGLQNLISKALAENIHRTDGRKTETLSPDVVSLELERIVQNVDKRLPHHWGRDGGTTMSLVLQLGDWIYLINTGDSQSFIGAHISGTKESLLLRITERHAPSLPQEAKRIQEAGGRISSDGSYVVYMHTTEEHGLAMTRSLGDHLAPGVIATPSIFFVSKDALLQEALDQIKVNHSNGHKAFNSSDVSLFAVSLSDGILDVMHHNGQNTGPNEVAAVVGRAFFEWEKDCQHPLVTTKDLMDICATRWYTDCEGCYRDDISIAASKLL